MGGRKAWWKDGRKDGRKGGRNAGWRGRKKEERKKERNGREEGEWRKGGRAEKGSHRLQVFPEIPKGCQGAPAVSRASHGDCSKKGNLRSFEEPWWLK